MRANKPRKNPELANQKARECIAEIYTASRAIDVAISKIQGIEKATAFQDRLLGVSTRCRDIRKSLEIKLEAGTLGMDL